MCVCVFVCLFVFVCVRVCVSTRVRVMLVFSGVGGGGVRGPEIQE